MEKSSTNASGATWWCNLELKWRHLMAKKQESLKPMQSWFWGWNCASCSIIWHDLLNICASISWIRFCLSLALSVMIFGVANYFISRYLDIRHTDFQTLKPYFLTTTKQWHKNGQCGSGVTSNEIWNHEILWFWCTAHISRPPWPRHECKIFQMRGIFSDWICVILCTLFFHTQCVI